MLISAQDPAPQDTGDAGTPDAGTPDAGTQDEGTQDKGTPDEGTPDAGNPDAGNPDAGTPDKGTPDEGTPDEGAQDKGTPDKKDETTSPKSGATATTVSSSLSPLRILTNSLSAAFSSARRNESGEGFFRLSGASRKRPMGRSRARAAIAAAPSRSALAMSRTSFTTLASRLSKSVQKVARSSAQATVNTEAPTIGTITGPPLAKKSNTVVIA